jgi:Ca2+-binding EF-hand superfamily protein
MKHANTALSMALCSGLFITGTAAVADGSFSVYDKNKDNYLDRAEYGEFLQRSPRSQREDPDFQFDTVDADSDGRVSGQEMVKVLQLQLQKRSQSR